jgi:hypothetical protein
MLWVLKIALSVVEWTTDDHPPDGGNMTAGMLLHLLCGVLLTPLCFGACHACRRRPLQPFVTQLRLTRDHAAGLVAFLAFGVK